MNDLAFGIKPFNPGEEEVTTFDIDKWKTSSLGSVYVIQDNLGRIKIGTSLNPERRIMQIKTGAGVRVVEEYISIQGSNYKEVEKQVHRTFDHHRTSGEWFAGLDFRKAVNLIESLEFIIPTDESIVSKIIDGRNNIGFLANVTLNATNQQHSNEKNTNNIYHEYMAKQGDRKMTNKLEKFFFNDNEVRTIQDESSAPWFVAKDLAEALGYTWNGSSRVAHIPDEWKGVTSVVTPGGLQDITILSEQGVYFFLCRSDKTKAIPMQKWIAGEVLPAIRKTGGYSIQRNNPESLGPISKGFKDAITIAKAAGLKGNAAVVAANKTMVRSFGVDILELLDIKGAVSDDSLFNKDCEIFKETIAMSIQHGREKPTFRYLESRRTRIKGWSEEYAESVIATLEKRGEIITKPGRISTQYFLA